MEYKTFPSKVEEIADDDRTVTGISSVIGVIDAGLDRIHKGAFVKTIAERAERVKHLWQHDFTQPPIASIVDLREVGKSELPKDLREKFPEAKGGLLVKRRYLDTPRGNEVLAGLKSGPPAITEMSFGYDPVKFDFEELEDTDMKGMLVRNLREVRLWDTSDVNWGMNEATVAVVKKAVPFKDTGTSDSEDAWSRPNVSDFTGEDFATMSTAEKNRIAAHFAWTANSPPESYGDLKLPHHAPGKTGVGPAVWKGVSAAMGRLMQSATDIPEGDRRAVYGHLSKHYAQFDKEPPDFKALELVWAVDAALEFLAPVSRPLVKGVAFDVDAVFEQLSKLDLVLRAEPRKVDTAFLLTQRKLVRELAIRQRQLVLLGH